MQFEHPIDALLKPFIARTILTFQDNGNFEPTRSKLNSTHVPKSTSHATVAPSFEECTGSELGHDNDGDSEKHFQAENRAKMEKKEVIEMTMEPLANDAPVNAIFSSNRAADESPVPMPSPTESGPHSINRELLIGPTPDNRLSVKEVNWIAIARGTRASYLTCFGPLVDSMSIGRLKMWDIVGDLNTTWFQNIRPMVYELIQNNWTRLVGDRPATGAPVYALRAYLVGWGQGHAAPHVAFLSSSRNRSFSKQARKIVLEHALLKTYGWGLSFVCLRLKTGIVQPMLPDPSAKQQRLPQPSRQLQSLKATHRPFKRSHTKKPPALERLPAPTPHYGVLTIRSCDSNEAIWSPIVLNQALGRVGGVRYLTARGTIGTIGGIIAVQGHCYGLTAAHVSQRNENATGLKNSNEPDGSDSGDDTDTSDDSDAFLDYDNEDMALITEVARKYNDELGNDLSDQPIAFGSTTLDFKDLDPRPERLKVVRAETDSASIEPTDVPDKRSFSSDTSRDSSILIEPYAASNVKNRAINASLDWALVTLPRNYDHYRSPFIIEDPEMDFWWPKSVAEHMPPDGEELMLCVGIGQIRPQSVTSAASISIGTDVSIPNAWVVRTGDINEGDCGAWIADYKQDNVLGMLVAYSPELKEAYLAPLCQIIEDVKYGFGIEDVDLVLPPWKRSDRYTSGRYSFSSSTTPVAPTKRTKPLTLSKDLLSSFDDPLHQSSPDSHCVGVV
ncbi:MAG: hypothetical protein M1820_000846 [Bogoriella megaspora]|nr:MAG: hypothetical protein M1820_000846 [Bogoriella megaspora]